MKPFSFRLESLLKYRKHQRDLCRQLLADVLDDQSKVEFRLEEISQDRRDTETSLQQAGQSGPIAVHQMSSQRYYISQLDRNRAMEQDNLKRVGQQLDLCRQALRQADTAVKALETLRDKQQKQHELAEIKANDLAVQDTWNGIRHTSSTPHS